MDGFVNLLIVYYGTTFFENSGISDGFTITLITNVINVVSTFPGLWMVEKWGRRNLLMFGAIGMAVCQLIVASVGTALPGQPEANKALIAFVCIYIFFFASSWGPVAWVVTGGMLRKPGVFLHDLRSCRQAGKNP